MNAAGAAFRHDCFDATHFNGDAVREGLAIRGVFLRKSRRWDDSATALSVFV
jgi:hypothetical protein